MSISPTLPEISEQNRVQPGIGAVTRARNGTGRPRKSPGMPVALYSHAAFTVEGNEQRQAELFYLQKQIHTQTPMVIVLEDGERVEGCIEWYDRNSIKVRGRAKSLAYKSAIKYMFKLGEGV